MATAEAQICNRALARIGVKVWIDDLITDQSEEAEACRVFYEDTRDSLLKQFWWPFATRRATLALLTNEARGGWAYAFQLPADCLQPRYVWPDGLSQVLYTPVQPSQLLSIWANPRTPRNDQRVPFAIEMQSAPNNAPMLLCDYSTPTLVYTSKMADVGQFSALFTDALAWMMATDLAMALTLDPNRYKLAKHEADAALKLCEAMALNEQQEDVVPDSEIIAARL